MTPLTAWITPPPLEAATEPAHFERDDEQRGGQDTPAGRPAATEPAHFERDDRAPGPRGAELSRRAATEPAHFERDDMSSSISLLAFFGSRNGSRSFRAG